MLVAQVALYPIEAEDADQVIKASLECLDDSHLAGLDVGPVNTEIQGDTDEIFAALKQLFENACHDGGETSMVVTITNARR